MAQQIRDTSKSLIIFNQTLKALAKEKVPLNDKVSIIQSFSAAIKENSEVNIIVEKVRAALKNDLPANKWQLLPIDMPAGIEQKIKDELVSTDEKVFLAMEPANCQEALNALRAIAGNFDAQRNCTLLVEDKALRTHIRKLAELEFPLLTVTCRGELIDNTN